MLIVSSNVPQGIEYLVEQLTDGVGYLFEIF